MIPNPISHNQYYHINPQDKPENHQLLSANCQKLYVKTPHSNHMDVSFVLFSVGAIIPVIPYLFFTGWTGIIVSAIASAVGLFVIGALITLMTGRNPFVSGMRQVLFGLAAATVTFGIGRMIGVKFGRIREKPLITEFIM